MFDCKICGRSYSHKKSLYRHERENHEKVVVPPTQFICEICNIPCKRKIDLMSHIKEHKRKIRQCRILCAVNECQEKFMTYSRLNKHLLEEHSLKLRAEKHEFTEINGKFSTYLYIILLFI